MDTTLLYKYLAPLVSRRLCLLRIISRVSVATKVLPLLTQQDFFIFIIVLPPQTVSSDVQKFIAYLNNAQQQYFTCFWAKWNQSSIGSS